MQYEWKVGDRAKVVRNFVPGGDDTVRYCYVGDVFTVQEVRLIDDMGVQLEGVTDEGEHRGIFAARCKPVVRVQAWTEPKQWVVGQRYQPVELTPDQMTERYWVQRRAHGGSRYLTGEQVFKPWDFGRGPVPRYEEMGN